MAKTLSEVKAEMLEKARSKPLGAFAVFNRNGKVMTHSAGAFEHIFTDEEDITWAKANGYTWHEETMDDGRVLTFFDAKPKDADYIQSADGQYYLEANLPENGDDYVTEWYSAQQKAERNVRLSDTDDYERLPSKTVQREEGGKRTALTDDERAEVLAYRQALRDLTDAEGFPFVDMPTIPTCIAYECQQKINERKAQEKMYGYN